MTREELNQMIEESKERHARYMEKRLAQLQEEAPDLVIDPKKARLASGFNLIYQVDNLSYYEVNHSFAILLTTDLANAIKYAGTYQAIETSWKSFVVSCPIGNEVRVQEFFKDTGNRLKGKRAWRRILTNSKGTYVTLDGTRHYLTIV